MFTDILKIFFVIVSSSLIILKFLKYNLLKKSFINYINSLKTLKEDLSIDSQTNIELLQSKLNKISIYGLKVIFRMIIFVLPYFFAFIILILTTSYIPFGFLVFLPSLSYLSLFKYKLYE